jgi:hypothetical protein
MCGWTPEGGPREVRSTGRGVMCCLGEMTVSLGRPYWGNYVSPTVRRVQAAPRIRGISRQRPLERSSKRQKQKCSTRSAAHCLSAARMD